MRVTGNSFTDSIVNQMNLLSARQYRLQNQAATGQRIHAPEDDPTGMALALNLQSETSTVDQYAQNIGRLQTRATASYDVLRQLKTLSDRIGEISIQASSGVQQAGTLQTYAKEVTQLIRQAVQLMNTKQGNQYLFGGTASGQPPFTMTEDAGGNISAVSYQGNSSVAESELAEEATIAVDVPGENNSGAGARGVISDSRYGADLFDHLISLQNHLLAEDSSSIASIDLPNLTKDEDNLIYQVATNGAVQVRLDVEATVAQNRKSYLLQSIAQVAGADLTQTLVQLSQAQNAYQAALSSASNILQLQQTLLNYL